MTEAQEGVRFSLNYLSHPELLPDSKRMRRRLGLVFFKYSEGGNLRSAMNRELGIGLTSSGYEYEFYWPKTMLVIELRDVLDTVTLVCRPMRDRAKVDSRQLKYLRSFIADVQRIFKEEGVRYTVDEHGGVHLAVDTAFEQTRISAVRSLGSKRYEAVRQALEAAYEALDQVPPDGKAAMRCVFSANENLFRLIFPRAHQLGTSELTKHLKTSVDRKYDGQNPAIRAAQKQFSQYSDWVSGAHFYRHESGTEEPSQPPLEMALHYVTCGTAWLRWLQSFDEQQA